MVVAPLRVTLYIESLSQNSGFGGCTKMDRKLGNRIRIYKIKNVCREIGGKCFWQAANF